MASILSSSSDADNSDSNNDNESESHNRTPRQANLRESPRRRPRSFVRVPALFGNGLDDVRTCRGHGRRVHRTFLYGTGARLGRYGLGRASARDVASVQIAANLVSQILEFLLQLDFRNGPLRRKYDGTKYSLKSLVTLIYKLTITGGAASDNGSDNGSGGDAVMKQEEGDGQEPATKRAKMLQLLPTDDSEAIGMRMQHHDALREVLIRNPVTAKMLLSKTRIFALYRGDPQKALQLLQECHEHILQQLLPIVHEETPLRNGCFANVLEEYV
jgi:hypothetical protein